jgi:hypothetical protein
MRNALPPAAERQRLAPRLLVSFIAALSLVLGPLAFAPAQAADGSSVSGTAIGEGGVSLADSSVDLVVEEGPEGYYAEPAFIDAAGNYSIKNVPDGTYRVRVYGKGNFVRTLSEPIVVKGADVTVDSLTLPLGGSVSGSIVGTNSKQPVSGVIVLAYPVLDDDAAPFGTWASEGRFTLSAVPAGQYVLEFRDNFGQHVTEFYDNARDAASATKVTVVKDRDTPLRDVSLDEGASLQGLVTNVAGDPIPFASVAVLPVVDGKTNAETAVYGSADENGAYDITSLPAGQYKVRIGAEGFFDRYQGGESTEELAQVMSLAVGQSVPLGTTVLEQAASVAGNVTNADGELLDGVYVNVYPVVNGVLGSTILEQDYTDEEGAFAFPKLRAGTYRLEFSAGNSVYQDSFSGDITVEAGEKAVLEPVVLGLAPVVVPPTPPVVVPPAPYSPPAAPKPVAKKAATVKVDAKGAKKKATLTITVKASGVTPTGKVTIKLGSKTLKTVTLKGGKAKVTLTKQKKGKRTYKVIYSGDSKVRTKSVTTSTVTIK